MKKKSDEYEYKLAMQQKEYETVVQENKLLKEIIDEKNGELQRKKRAQGGASRIHQLEEKVKKLESENMAMECEMGELLELLSNGDAEEEEEEADEEEEEEVGESEVADDSDGVAEGEEEKDKKEDDRK